MLKKLVLNAFGNLRELQNFNAVLHLAKGAGITDIPALSEFIQQHIITETVRRKNEQREVIKQIGSTTKQKAKPLSKKGNEMVFPIHCPECGKGPLAIKSLEGVVYVACHQCRKSMEFK